MSTPNTPTYTRIEDYSPAMAGALRALWKLIDAGVEFPDACWKVARQRGLTVDELRAAYDHVQR